MLKPRNTAANVITAILAALLSILLVVILFVTALLGTVNSITTPRGLSRVVSTALQVDFDTILALGAEDMDISEDQLQEAKIITRLLDTEAAEEVIDLFCKGIAANWNGEEDILVTDMHLRKIVHEHADEIVDILCDIDPSIDRETVREEMLKYVDENSEELMSLLLDGVAEITESAEDFHTVLDIIKTAFIALVVLCVILAGAIYGCRWYRFGGFLWVGIDTAIAALLTFVPALLIKNGFVADLMGIDGIVVTGSAESTFISTAFKTAIINAASAGIADLFIRTAIILLVVGILFIGLFIILKCTVINPKLKAAQIPAEELPATEA